MSITYCKKNGALYASDSHSYREGTKIKKDQVVYLGRVLDKERGIYKTRARGIYHYDPKTRTFTPLSEEELRKLQAQGDTALRQNPGKTVPSSSAPQGSTEKEGTGERNSSDSSPLEVLDFGDAWVVSELLRQEHFERLERAVWLDDGQRDTLRALLTFYLTTGLPLARLQDWYGGSFACRLYPQAKVDEQSVLDLLGLLGAPDPQDRILRARLQLLRERGPLPKSAVLITWEGPAKSTRLPLTGLRKPDGSHSRQMDVCLAVDRDTGDLLWAGLSAGVHQAAGLMDYADALLEQTGIRTALVLPDGGDDHLCAAQELLRESLPFILPLAPDHPFCAGILQETLPDLDRHTENLVRFCPHSFAFVTCTEASLNDDGDTRLFAYVCRDLYRSHEETSVISLQADRLSIEEAGRLIQMSGVFVLLSSEKLSGEDVLAEVLRRRGVAQAFPAFSFLEEGAGRDSLLSPDPVEQSEDTLRGSLLLTFLAASLRRELENRLSAQLPGQKRGSGKETRKTAGRGTQNAVGGEAKNEPAKEESADSALLLLRRHKCAVYPDRVRVLPVNEQTKDVYRRLGVTPPREIGRTAGSGIRR